MKLYLNDIINKHRGTPAVVAAHGPSLNGHKDAIQEGQRRQKLLRFSVNEWFSFFEQVPDYWVVSNTEFTIKNSIVDNILWRQRGYPFDVFNKYRVPLIYNRAADNTEEEFINENLKCDYLPFDNKHFKGHTCREILTNFKNFYDSNGSLDFPGYGNNTTMWQRPDISEATATASRVHGRVAGSWAVNSTCCDRIVRPTFQEKLQEVAQHKQHMSPGQTVGTMAIAFAVLAGCNPIYISGLDLDYSMGHAESETNYQISAPNIGHWKYIYRHFLLDDMRILKESAENLGIKIINLNKNSWHKVFDFGDFS